MKAQFLYDLREQTEFTSGSDLQDFFERVAGDPCLSGNADIDDDIARAFVRAECAHAVQFAARSEEDVAEVEQLLEHGQCPDCGWLLGDDCVAVQWAVGSTGFVCPTCANSGRYGPEECSEDGQCVRWAL